MNYKQQLIQKFFDFENWIIRGAKDDLTSGYARELMKLHKEDVNGYYHYRNELYKLIKKIVNENKVLNDFNALLIELRRTYSEESELLVEFYSSEENSNLFTFKRNNVIELIDMLKDSKSITQSHLHLYLNYYEIELSLVVLATAVKLSETGALDLELANLKDNKGKLKKGNAVAYISARLENYKDLKYCLEEAYNNKIRNTIGHNDYKIEKDKIVSFDNKIEISREDFLKSLYYIQEINNTLINVMSTASIENNINTLVDCGILGIGFAWDKDCPLLIVLQLWCFYDLDNTKEWLLEVNFKILDDEIQTFLNNKSSQKGPYDSRLKEWFDVLKNNKYELMVEVQSIIPQMDDSGETVELEGNSFQMKDDYIKKVKVFINE